MTKQSESELANIDFEILPIKGNLSLIFYCFAKPSTACTSGSNHPIFMGFSAKRGIENAKYICIEN